MRHNFFKSPCKSYEIISQSGRQENRAVAEINVMEGILDITDLDSPFIESEREFLQVFLKELKVLH